MIKKPDPIQQRAIVWFRQDFRLSDNPALFSASKCSSILPVFILDDINAQTWGRGSASRVWLHHALDDLDARLGGKLAIHTGPAELILPQLVAENQIDIVMWNRCYEPWRTERDAMIKRDLEKNGVKAISFNGSLLWEPWEIKKLDETPYKVFTPFFRNGCQNAAKPRDPLPAPTFPNLEKLSNPESLTLDQLKLVPEQRIWPKDLMKDWQVGEDAAVFALNGFIKNKLSNYKSGRDHPAQDSVSRLSPYLHYGHISPNQIWAAVNKLKQTDQTLHFQREIAWREFSYGLLFHNPELPQKNLQPKFDYMSWTNDAKRLRSWQKGQTGIPIVDAGMRELWQTGYMHNRVRMIVASFLIKNLQIDWREGQKWFWDCLVDADLANNSASWQWVAGSGADAAPYFRVFNPVLQASKFDSAAEYIKKYVPELADLPSPHIFDPTNAPAMALDAADIVLGETYPHAIVDLKQSREAALANFKSMNAQVELHADL